MAWIPAAITAGGSILGGLLGGDGDSESGGAQTITQAPMPWEADAKQFWDEFVANWYGTPVITGVQPPTSNLTTPSAIDSLKKSLVAMLMPSSAAFSGVTKKPLQASLLQNPPSGGALSYRQRLEQDILAKQKAGEQFITDVTAAEQPYSTLLQNILMQPSQYYRPIGFKAGDFQTSFVPRTDIRMVDELKKTATERAALGTGAAGRELALAEQFTPNRAYMDYMNKLQGLAMQLQSMRYGLPTQSSSATGTYTPGWQEVLSNAINAGLNVYQGLRQGQTATQLPSASTINTSDIWDPSKLFSNVWPE